MFQFQSTLPARGATANITDADLSLLFQSTLPARGATRPSKWRNITMLFQSTLPARGATAAPQRRMFWQVFQSTLPARGATNLCAGDGFLLHISIHAPRTGSDGGRVWVLPDEEISIHAPRTGSDPQKVTFCATGKPFQSTLPARGATRRSARHFASFHFNPRSPHGERHLQPCTKFAHLTHFNPRSPHGERLDTSGYTQELNNFNPRSPHGERRTWSPEENKGRRFQSTLPARGATPSFRAHSPA